MTRITQKFAELATQSRLGLVAYITAGDPSQERTVDFVLALEDAGADVVELGVPFSDPLADGVLITDLSVEEAEPFLREMRRADLDTIFLAAPTSTAERLRRIGEVSRGFVYAVSRMGVTGTRDTLSSQVLPLVERLRAVTALPLAAGFGISRREHLDVLKGKIDAAVVGSALVRVIEEHGASPEGPRKLAQAVKELLHGH